MKQFCLSLVLFAVFATPLLALAQPSFFGPIVPCGQSCDAGGGTEGIVVCTTCDLVALIQRIINFLIFAAVALATLLFVYSGWLMITSGGNSGKLTQAKAIFWHVFIGIIIVLAAWLIVNIIMFTLYQGSAGGGWRPWNSIICDSNAGGGQCRPAARPEFTVGDVTGFGEGTGTGPQAPSGQPPSLEIPQAPDTSHLPAGQCHDCAPVAGIPLKSSNACSGQAADGCQVNGQLLTNLQNLNSAVGGSGWEVTETWPPTVQHQNPCHANGTCVDAAIRDLSFDPNTSYSSLTPAQQQEYVDKVVNFSASAQRNDLRPVFETRDLELASAVKNAYAQAGVANPDSLVHTGNYAPHFSLYCLNCE